MHNENIILKTSSVIIGSKETMKAARFYKLLHSILLEISEADRYPIVMGTLLSGFLILVFFTLGASHASQTATDTTTSFCEEQRQSIDCYLCHGICRDHVLLRNQHCLAYHGRRVFHYSSISLNPSYEAQYRPMLRHHNWFHNPVVWRHTSS